MPIAGFRTISNDETVRNNISNTWSSLPQDALAFLAVYETRTYRQWVNDGYDESGQPINPREETFHYMLPIMHRNIKYVNGKVTEVEGTTTRMWYDARTDTFGCGVAADVPPGAIVRRMGTVEDNASWHRMYNSIKDMQVPG